MHPGIPDRMREEGAIYQASPADPSQEIKIGTHLDGGARADGVLRESASC